MPKPLLSLFAAASVGRLANLFPRWLNSKVANENGITDTATGKTKITRVEGLLGLSAF